MTAVQPRLTTPEQRPYRAHTAGRGNNEAHVGGHPSPYEVAAQGAGKENQPDDDPTSR